MLGARMRFFRADQEGMYHTYVRYFVTYNIPGTRYMLSRIMLISYISVCGAAAEHGLCLAVLGLAWVGLV